MALHQIASYGDSDSESSDTEITQKTEKRKQIVSILPRKRTAQESSVKEHVKIILPQLEVSNYIYIYIHVYIYMPCHVMYVVLVQ